MIKDVPPKTTLDLSLDQCRTPSTHKRYGSQSTALHMILSTDLTVSSGTMSIAGYWREGVA
jgi:hypothetical protein